MSKVVASDLLKTHNPGILLLSNGYILDLKTLEPVVDNPVKAVIIASLI